MKLHFEEIVELIHREMYVRNGVMLGSKAAAKAILQAEEAAQQPRAVDFACMCAEGAWLPIGGSGCERCGGSVPQSH